MINLAASKLQILNSMKTAKDIFLTIFLFSRSPNRQKLHFLALLVFLVKRFSMRFSIATSPIVAATPFPSPSKNPGSAPAVVKRHVTLILWIFVNPLERFRVLKVVVKYSKLYLLAVWPCMTSPNIDKLYFLFLQGKGLY